MRKVTDRMTPEGKKLFKELNKLAKLEVQAGFTAGKKGYGENHSPVDAADYPGGPSVAEVAAWNEFGTRNADGSQRIPARPFMRQSVDKYGPHIQKMLALQLEAVAKGEAGADKALRAIGALQVGLIQHEICDGGFTENAGSTKALKGSSTPLIDEGRMRQSVHYAVKSREG